MRNIFLASAILVASGCTASAADLPARTYTKAPIVAPLPTWAGFYVGGFGGYAWSNEVSADVPALGVGGSISSEELKGGFGGGTIGYNWQGAGSPFVFGIEVDAAGASIRYSESALGVTAADKIDSFGTVTGRVGYAFNNALIYAKGGWGWANNEISASGFGIVGSESKFHSGFTIGGGLEYMFAPAWSAKVEYQYLDLDKENYVAALVPGGVNVGASLHTVKGGINYHFTAF